LPPNFVTVVTRKQSHPSQRRGMPAVQVR